MAYMQNDKTHLENALSDGKLFAFHNVLEVDDGDTVYVQLKTPTDKTVQLYWKIWCDTGSFETWFYEGATAQTDGSLVTPLNYNRQSSTTATAVLRSGVSAPASTGTELVHTYSGKAGTGGWGGEPAEGGSGDVQQLILAKDTNHIRKFISHDDGNKINIIGFWIEEDE